MTIRHAHGTTASLAARALALAAAAPLLAAPGWAQTIHHVDADLTTGANDGTSWTNAYQGSQGLHAALAAAAPGDEVWIAKGLYLPSPGTDTSARFTLETDEVTIRGGFEGFEVTPLERRFDAGVETVLSGDLLGNDDGTAASTLDNSARVLHVTSSRTILEDLRITAGGNEPNGVNLSIGPNGSPSSVRGAKVVRCRCDHGVGAGARIVRALNPFPQDIMPIIDSTFDSNRDEGLIVEGQGVFDFVLERNRTLDNGGAGLKTTTAYFFMFVADHISARNGGPGIEIQLLGRPFCDTVYTVGVHRCTLVDNADAGLRVVEPPLLDCGVSLQVESCIVWDNGGTDQVALPTFFVQPNIVTNSLIGTAGGGSPDPLFRDQAGGDYSLLGASPGIDAVTPPQPNLFGAIEFDARGQHRVVDVPGIGGGPGGAVMDVGALEFTGSLGRHDGCDSAPNSTGQEGLLFARGSEEVAANSFSVRGDQLPPGQFAMLLASRQLGATPTVGGPGTLCLGGAIGRFNRPGQIQPISPDGLFQLPVDLTQLPQPSSFVAAAPGESWRFQLWHRDVPGPSQFSGIVTVRFR